MDACVANLNKILTCNEAPPRGQNPMNWKFGGALTDGTATYLVVPQIDREYTPGVCSFHLYELEGNPYVPEETNGHWYPPEYLLQNKIVDGDGNVVSTLTGYHNEYGVDGKDPYIYNGFYAPLEMTPEQADGDYVQFHIGAILWSTKASSDGAYCNVGGWTVVRPMERDMDCFFPC